MKDGPVKWNQTLPIYHPQIDDRPMYEQPYCYNVLLRLQNFKKALC
jgi:hypothetical protein